MIEKPRPSKTYICWIGIRSRCNSPNHPRFNHYGGRGIRVCERWNSYANFLADMGKKPKGKSIERIDVNGHYEPSNCRWATQTEQMRNMRITRRITIEGRTYVAADLADILGVKTDTIVSRAKVCKTYAELMDTRRRVFTDGLSLGGPASGAKKRAKTRCVRGHRLTKQNVSMTPEGWRRCKKCHALREKQRRNKTG